MVGNDLVVVSFPHFLLTLEEEGRNANIHQPGRNHKPPHQNPSQRPIHLLELAIQLPDSHDHATGICKSPVENLFDLLWVEHAPRPFTSRQLTVYDSTGIFNAAIFPCVWLFFPEPKGRSLEELDVIFASAHAKKENPVKTAREAPRLQGPELERELERYFDINAVSA